MFSSAEEQELRAYYARYPFDDESNIWLPHGLLMAKVSNIMGSAASPPSYKDFMPYAKMAEEQEETETKSELMYTPKQQKRIAKRVAKYNGW